MGLFKNPKYEGKHEGDNRRILSGKQLGEKRLGGDTSPAEHQLKQYTGPRIELDRE